MCKLILALALAQNADAVGAMLDRGPLVLVEEAKGGKFGQATAITQVDGTVDQVWDTLIKFDEYKNYMPKVLTSEIVKKDKDGKTLDVHFVLDVPGPDTDYVIRYTLDTDKKEMTGHWADGDLKGSAWQWKVETGPNGKTLLSERVQVKNFSSILQNVEDDQQTITVGVNVSSALAAVKGVKNRVEHPAKK
jgi:hypothetical protein